MRRVGLLGVLIAVALPVQAPAAPAARHQVAWIAWSSGGFQVVDAILAAGALPARSPRLPAPALRFEALDADGTVVAAGDLADPRVLRGDVPDDALPGGLRAVRAIRERGTLAVRLPIEGARLRFLAPGAAARVLGEVPWPVPREAAPAAAAIEVLEDNGPASNRMNLVILGDGYRLEDQAKLTADATAFRDGLFASLPWSEYRGFFNVTLVHVVSAQDGADNGFLGPDRDTALGAVFGCGADPGMLCVDDAAAQALAKEVVPDYDVVLVAVNEGKCGGSGGAVAVFSTCASAVNGALHELGHVFAGLADEYDRTRSVAPCDGECHEPNVTMFPARGLLKWGAWVSQYVPLPTPESATYASVVGAFEGARYQPTGVWRPRIDCRMNTVAAPFCEVCREALILVMHDRVSMIEDPSPSGPVFLGPADSVRLSLGTPAIPATISWSLDDGPLDATGAEADLAAADLGAGEHRVRAVVVDPTPRVLRDLDRLVSKHEWVIHVAAGPGDHAPDAAPGDAVEDEGLSAGEEAPGADAGDATVPEASGVGGCGAGRTPAGGLRLLVWLLALAGGWRLRARTPAPCPRDGRPCP